ncbi:alpha/beta hydrolase [Ornithinibacillus californiensis]|uniref:alpha/beta hydrolase n=1 Tax=Ornithinibacillus californiensis TaxID=161536 RepID=UPI00064DCB6C|nr:alpha/beta hydrolase [Ornithinibacillus californiensis]
MAKFNSVNASIHYIMKPNPTNDTIVLLHGVGLDHTEFNFLLPYLENYQLLSYDLRWHGQSDGTFYSSDEENWQVLINDFLVLLDKERINNFHIVAHGIGAQLTVELVSRGIVKPKTVTVLSTPFYYPKEVAEKGIQFRAEQIKGMSGRELGKWMIPQIMANHSEEKHEIILSAFDKVNLELYIDIFRLNANAISLEKLTKFTIPTLLLNGELDVNYPPELTSLSAKYLPDVRTKIIRNASNLVHVDQPKEVATIIHEFIEQHTYLSSGGVVGLDLPYLSLLHKELNRKEKLFIRVDFLTVFEMKVNGKIVYGKWNQRKAKELLAYLTYYGRSSKGKVYEALWPNSSEQNAQNLLRVAIHHLRTLLKNAGLEEFIFTDTQYVWINDKAEIRCDVIEAMNGIRVVPENQLFSDLPMDWTRDIQFELEKRLGLLQ